MASAMKNLRAVATVRIAPVERWCEDNLRDLANYPHSTALVGKAVEIYPASLSTKWHDGARTWLVTDETLRMFEEIVGHHYVDIQFALCEHMLEMD